MGATAHIFVVVSGAKRDTVMCLERPRLRSSSAVHQSDYSHLLDPLGYRDIANKSIDPTRDNIDEVKRPTTEQRPDAIATAPQIAHCDASVLKLDGIAQIYLPSCTRAVPSRKKAWNWPGQNQIKCS